MVAIVGSLVTEPIPENYLHRLTFWHEKEIERERADISCKLDA